MRIAYDLNLGPRAMKAWSQNLGHDSILTSFNSYGALTFEEQAAIIGAINPDGGERNGGMEELIRQFTAQVIRVGGSGISAAA